MSSEEVHQCEEEQQDFFTMDAERMLDEAYEKLKQQKLNNRNIAVTPPDIFSKVHAHSNERPIIGGTALYQRLWDNVQQAHKEMETEAKPSP